MSKIIDALERLVFGHTAAEAVEIKRKYMEMVAKRTIEDMFSDEQAEEDVRRIANHTREVVEKRIAQVFPFAAPTDEDED